MRLWIIARLHNHFHIQRSQASSCKFIWHVIAFDFKTFFTSIKITNVSNKVNPTAHTRDFCVSQKVLSLACTHTPWTEIFIKMTCFHYNSYMVRNNYSYHANDSTTRRAQWVTMCCCGFGEERRILCWIFSNSQLLTLVQWNFYKKNQENYNFHFNKSSLSASSRVWLRKVDCSFFNANLFILLHNLCNAGVKEFNLKELSCGFHFEVWF